MPFLEFTYTGGTVVSAGTLRGTTSSLQGNITNDATVEFDQSSDGTYAGNISGTGSLVKSGSGKVTLDGTISSTGGTTVSGGTLSGNTSNLQGDIATSATVEFNQTNLGNYSGSISGSGNVVKSGTGMLEMQGTNTYTGGTTVSEGYLSGNTNSLQGDITNNANLIFAQSNDGTYAGSLSGSGALTKTGGGTLALTGTNSYSGGTTVEAGELQGTTASIQGDIVNDNLVNFNQDTDGTYAGDMSGTGMLSKQGTGTLTLTGDHTQTLGAVAFDGGLVVNGTVTGEVTIGQDATLGGTGQISQLSLYGTFAPGNSIGTTTIAGDAEFNSDSTTQIEINDGGTTPGVNNDLIDVSGDVTIFGGSVEVDATAGNYTHGAIYTFLTAGSISGTYDSIIDNLAFFDASLIYNVDSVQFELIAHPTDFASVSGASNQQTVGQYIDDNSQGPPAELQTLIDAMTPMTTQQVQHSLDQMSGAVYASAATANLQHTSYYLNRLTERLRSQMVPQQSGGPGMFAELAPALPSVDWQEGELVVRGQSRHSAINDNWVTGYGLGGVAQSDGESDGFHYGVGGTQLGLQWRLNQNWNLGGWANLAWSELQGDQLNEVANLENYHFGTFLTGFDGDDYWIALGGMGYDHGEVRRRFNIGANNSLAEGQYDGWQANAYVERGLSLHRRGWNLQPYTALQYIYLRQNELRETGAGMLDLAVGGLDVHSLRSVLGGRFSTSRCTRKGYLLTPEVRAAWLHEFLDTNQVVSAGFADLGGAGFAVRGLDLGRDWAMLGGGLNFEFQPGARLFAGYDVQLNDYQVFHVGSGGMEFLW